MVFFNLFRDLLMKTCYNNKQKLTDWRRYMDNKVTIIMRIIFQYALSILIFYVAKIFFPVISKVVILYYIIALLIIILLHLNNIVVIFKKRQQKTIKLFNIYYINALC